MCERVTDKREGEGDGSNEVGRYSVSLLLSIETALFGPRARVWARGFFCFVFAPSVRDPGAS